MNSHNLTTVEVIQKIVKENSSIQWINIHSYPDGPQLQERVKFNRIEEFHYSNALKLRKSYNVPFWDALMLSFYNKKEFSVEILENVLNSHSKKGLQLVSRNDILHNKLLNLACSDENYAINSKVIVEENRIKHFLLLDFHIPENDKNQKVVEAILRILKVKSGFLLKSGKSYHFFGTELISTSTLTKFLGKCLFFTPIIDKTWIAHQLIERSCSIRFTRKNNLFPTVIEQIDNSF